MCGIAGIIRFDGGRVDPVILQQACFSLRHRGPDDEGIWIDDSHDGRVGMAATRLAVLDPSPAGHQPMHRYGGRFHLVHNGEIYNYRHLRSELSALGDSFVTDSDTEVLLALFARWGPEGLTRLNGMWALAFFDSETGSGFLARDRFGVKPLLYVLDERGLAFASEIQVLRGLWPLEPTIDEEALTEHLVFGYISGAKSIYRESRRLEPGHVLEFSRNAAQRPRRYYRIPSPPDAAQTGDYAESCGRLRRLLGEAVVRRRVSDVPIGTLLSGGVDSSIVTLHLAEATGRPVRTFSVGFAEDAAFDESVHARTVAEYLGTEHYPVVLTRREILDAIPKILDHLGEPVGDSSIIPTALLSRFVGRSVKVVLSGDAGDELFGGYWRYLGHEVLKGYQHLPAPIKAMVAAGAGLLHSGRSSVRSNRVRQFRKLIRAQASDPLARHLTWSRILSPQAVSIFTRPECVEQTQARALEKARDAAAGFEDADPLNRILVFDLHHQLPADMLQKVDLASMMHSLEVRTPFLDPEVVAFAVAIPAEYKIHRGLRKRILMDAYRGRLPDDILDRPKRGFEVPIGEYLRGPLRDLFHDVVTRETIHSFGLLSFEGIAKVYDDHLHGREDHADLLFALLSLCWWKRHSNRARMDLA